MTERGQPDHEPVGGDGAGTLGSAGSTRYANFLELFFDLVLVFALLGVVSRVQPDLSSASVTHRWTALLYVPVLALPMLWLWTTTAHITSHFDPRRPLIQVMVLVSALGLVMMASTLPYAFVGRGIAFALTYVLLQVGRPVLLITLLRNARLRALYLRSAIWFSVSGVPWLAGVTVTGHARVALWGLAIAIELVAARFSWPVPGLGRQLVSAWALGKPHHLADRYQQLLLIALGETVLSLGTTYAAVPVTLATTLALLVGFLTSVLLWRIYFYRSGQVLPEAVSTAGDRASAGRSVGRVHLLMVLGAVFVAIGYELVLKHSTEPVRPSWLVVILGGPVVFLVGRIGLERVVFDRLAVRRLVVIAALLLLGPPLSFGTPLIALAAAAVVLLGMALADARQARGRPLEAPAPSRLPPGRT
ncbi:low temperature requirement protein A [Micromonospora sp. NPDC049559]|uniref:low temperature requirement protein A n=1 Tax=Micromonospora sp. NPDC049559 TaxID=3155923 RepID=UPI00341BE9F9